MVTHNCEVSVVFNGVVSVTNEKGELLWDKNHINS